MTRADMTRAAEHKPSKSGHLPGGLELKHSGKSSPSPCLSPSPALIQAYLTYSCPQDASSSWEPTSRYFRHSRSPLIVMARTEIMSAAKRWEKSAEVQTHAATGQQGQPGTQHTPCAHKLPQALASYNLLEQATEADVGPWGPEGSVITCPPSPQPHGTVGPRAVTLFSPGAMFS